MMDAYDIKYKTVESSGVIKWDWPSSIIKADEELLLLESRSTE